MFGRWTRLRRFTRFSLRTFVLLILLLGSAGALWRQWEPWVEVAVLESEAQPSSSVSFSPDGSKILTFANGDSQFSSSLVKTPNTMRTWSSYDFRPLALMEFGEHPESSGLASGRFSPDGKWLVGEMIGHVRLFRLFDAETGADILKVNAKKIEFLPESSLALIHTEAGSCFIYDLEQGVRWAEIGQQEDFVSAAHATPNAEFLVTLGDPIRLMNAGIASKEANICVWDARTGKLLRAITNDSNRLIYSHQLSEDGKLVIGVLEEQKRTVVWEVETGRKITEFEGVPLPGNSQIPNSNFLILVQQTMKYQVIDVTSGKVVTHLAGSPLYPKPYTSDGKKLVFCDQDLNCFTILNLAECVQSQTSIPISSHDFSIFSEDSKFMILFSTTDHGSSYARIYDLEKWKFVMGCRAEVYILPGFGYAVTCKRGGKYPIQIWNLSTCSLVFEIPLGTYEDISASPDGQSIAFVSSDGTARVWERRRDEGTAGLFALPALWLTALFFTAFFWSAFRDVKELKSA